MVYLEKHKPNRRFMVYLCLILTLQGAAMAEDTEAARKARAERLHQQINRMKTGCKEEKTVPDVTKPDTSPAPGTETPRDFIHRRMRELDTKK
jgi:hypothetical protein